MPGFLKQSTASQTVQLGPYIDDTGFKTHKTGLTIANTDIKLSKAGGSQASKNSGGGTHDALGMYAITLDATDTNTVGKLQIISSVAGALVVWDTFTVVEEAVYDAFFAASAPGYVANAPVNAAQVGGQTASAAGTVTFPGTIASTTNITAGTITTASAVTTVNGLAANVITAASMASDASAEIADAVWDELISGHAISGSTGEALSDAGAAGTPPTAVENADALLGRSIAGGANGGRMVKDALKALRNRVGIATGTMTVYEADDSTPAWTAAVTTTAGDPLSEIDPA